MNFNEARPAAEQVPLPGSACEKSAKILDYVNREKFHSLRINWISFEFCGLNTPKKSLNCVLHDYGYNGIIYMQYKLWISTKLPWNISVNPKKLPFSVKRALPSVKFASLLNRRKMNVISSEQLPGVISEMADNILCGECGLPISSDRYIMKVNDVSYHERCVNCSVCNGNLLHSCFYRDGKLFCRIDYERWAFSIILFRENKSNLTPTQDIRKEQMPVLRW